MSNFKPMLAATVDDVNKLDFPLLASPKLDGVRALVINGQVVSRNLKPIPNQHVQALFGKPKYEGLDGELICGDPTDPEAFRKTSSAVMAHNGTPDVKFHIFDLICDLSHHFLRRFDAINRHSVLPNLYVVPHTLVNDLDDMQALEEHYLECGYEGLMLRDPAGFYKHGRSTFKEHGLMKLKRFADAEAKIVGFEEQLHNSNAAKTNALGAKERSTKKSGMVGKDTLGALKVVGINGPYKGVAFNIGSGFDDDLRAAIWAAQIQWQDLVVKYKYFPLGVKDAPRFPVYLGVRNRIDG